MQRQDSSGERAEVKRQTEANGVESGWWHIPHTLTRSLSSSHYLIISLYIYMQGLGLPWTVPTVHRSPGDR
eukprot:351486-Chlamydomonas_euryale.AAC.2